MTGFMLRAMLPSVAILAMGGAAGAATMGRDITALALGQGGSTLVTMAPGTGAMSSVALMAGGQAITLDDIDLRPATGELYGYDNSTATAYLVDRMTGEASAVASGPGLTSTDRAGFDFNNVLDAARVVTANRENVVFFPKNMPPNLARFTDLFYVAGDMNEGAMPEVRMNAYTNAVMSPMTTQQYVIDTGLDTLATLGNNAGTLTTLGGLYFEGNRVDFSDVGGFDILSMAEGDNTAFALLTLDGMQAIYTLPLMGDMDGRINLSFYAAVGDAYGALNGFTAAYAPAPVPVPAAFGLLALGLGAVGALRLKRRAG